MEDKSDKQGFFAGPAEGTKLDEELRFLARRHPRETWLERADIGELALFWLDRHHAFRSLGEEIASRTGMALDAGTVPHTMPRWLARSISHMVTHLEGHHTIEDRHYFPRFRHVEPRLARGFELLERDHDALHESMLRMVESTSALVSEAGESADARRTALGRFHDAHLGFRAGLLRHLDDEEDLVIPLLLEHGERDV